MVAGAPTARRFRAGHWQQISIFLSPMDVHVNRHAGQRARHAVKYHPGRFLPAYRSDAGDLNEFTEVTIDHGGQTVVVRQIVGILARRIVCRVKRGRRRQRWGSVWRDEVRVANGRVPAARGSIAAEVGDKVVGGVTVLAMLPDVARTRAASRTVSLVH